MVGGTGPWLLTTSVVDTTYGTGKVGIAQTNTTARLDDYYAGSTTGTFPLEAWTSRGAGVLNFVRASAAGWTAPLQVMDWYTKQLTAFTLTGLAQANLRALASTAASGISMRCEVAVVNSDGSSPTVWATWCIDGSGTNIGELGTSEAASTANVSGDDLSVIDGQRLRIRLYLEDSANLAMQASKTATFFYNGTSAAASGDSYITFAQTLAEFIPPSSFQNRPLMMTLSRHG